MSRVRPVTVTKVRQQHSAIPEHTPGRAYNGPNYVPQKAESAKKSVRKKSTARKATPQA